MVHQCMMCGDKAVKGDGHTKIFHNCSNTNDKHDCVCIKCTDEITTRLMRREESIDIVADYPHTKRHKYKRRWVIYVVYLWGTYIRGASWSGGTPIDVYRNFDISGISITRGTVAAVPKSG